MQQPRDTDQYTQTPGIEVGKQSVRGAGQFVFWDCAGQMEYSVTHGMFLGSGQSIFVVIYDLRQYSKGETVRIFITSVIIDNWL